MECIMNAGDPIFPLPNNWPVLPSEVAGVYAATVIVGKIAGKPWEPLSAARGSTRVVQELENWIYCRCLVAALLLSNNVCPVSSFLERLD